RDITLSPKFSCVTGYTPEELMQYFGDRIDQMSENQGINKNDLIEKITEWYDGYSWDGKNRLFNPFSILCFFSDENFSNYWWHTGTPTFLIKLLRKEMHYQFEKIKAGESIFESYNLQNLEFRSLMFQTGYLTILSVSPMGSYTLGYPNKEVRDSMYQHLLGAFREGYSVDSNPLVEQIILALFDKDIEEFIKGINILFESLPYQIFISDQEAFFHAILHISFHLMGIHIDSEVSTAKGRVDTIIKTESYIYIIEFKLDQSADEALSQIREQRYGSKYLNQGKEVIALGVSFSSKLKAVAEWKMMSYEDLMVNGY
ncbi:MAG: PD-(D/E)XK nuclease domain-containing protein, partial [Bacteroidetes bacterium]|nr:PD-(D/E)XK nuclease domain-containing protein [Bacteroidota bacterium]